MFAVFFLGSANEEHSLANREKARLVREQLLNILKSTANRSQQLLPDDDVKVEQHTRTQ